MIKNRGFPKLKNIENTVDMFYSTDGVKWIKNETSIEVYSLNHNALSEFLSFRIGLYAEGKGEVVFKNFIYKPIK